MAKKETKMPLPKIYLDDDLFSTQEQRDDKLKEKVVNISLNDIDDFPKHPFKVIDNEDMKQMVESISENGVLVPTLVRPKENGKYEMISGHRRKFASELAGLETIPCIVRELTDDEATIIMVDSNLQREKILPSEKAFAYKLKMEALSHQGIRNDLTSAPLGHKFVSREQIAKENGESREQVRRYVALTNLDSALLKMVDENKIALRPAVQISYMKKQDQKELLDARVIALYKNGENSYLEIFLSSSSLKDFLSKYYYAEALMNADKEFMQKVTDEKKEIEATKAELEKNKSALDDALSQQRIKQNSLERLKNEKQTYVAQLTAEEKENQQEIEKFEEDKRKIQAELKRIAEEEAKKAKEAAKNPAPATTSKKGTKKTTATTETETKPATKKRSTKKKVEAPADNASAE